MRHPGRLVVGGFASLITAGTVLLASPLAHEPGVDVGIADAFFTACSAVTVTGLGVVPTGASFSLVGEYVILTLIQVGGLGIMTLASVVGVFLSRRLGVRQSRLVGTEIGVVDAGSLRPVLRAVALFTLTWEAMAFAALFVAFLREGVHTIAGSAHLALFHAVSAFNNAGFSVFADGLRVEVDSPLVNLAVMATIVAGGVGFPVIVELVTRRHGPRRPWSLHTRVTLAMTAVLLIVGTLAILAMEWSNPATLGELPFGDKVLAAAFQSTTTRTAGFDTLPIGALNGGTHLLMILLMVIGAGSASTSGGIKVSTFAVVVAAAWAELRNHTDTTMLGRRLTVAMQRQALTLVVLALGAVGTMAFVISVANPTLLIEDVLFEAASAFGTVGLSTGITSDLDAIGRAAVIILMFVGRIGPVTFGSALLFRRRRPSYHLPSEDVILG